MAGGWTCCKPGRLAVRGGKITRNLGGREGALSKSGYPIAAPGGRTDSSVARSYQKSDAVSGSGWL
jgi:hypothetical protein